MKKYIFIILVLIGCLSMSNSAYSLPCCWYIQVDYSLNEECCLVIDVYNPYCYDAEIILEIDNMGTWVQVDSDTSNGTNIEFIYCPPPGTSVVNFRVLIADKYHPGEPHCNTDGYAEGITMYTRSAEINCCEECPDNFESWLQLNSKKSNNCPDNGCEITHSFNIPDSIDCYTSYKVDTDSNSTPILPIIGDSLFNIDGCIAAGTTFNVKVVLYTSTLDSCVIEKSIACDEPRDTNDFQPPCVPDCPETPFSSPPDSLRLLLMGCSGPCYVQVFYVHRRACGYWQDVQIVRMEMSSGCDGCSDASIYHQALLAIMDVNAMGFDPELSGCASTWRVTQGGCWSDWEYYVVNPTMGIVDTIRVLEPCTLTECCLQSMTVCKTVNPKTITITYDSTFVPGSIDCEDTWLEDPTSGWIIQCLPKCDWLEEFDDTHTPPDTVWGKKSIEFDYKSNNKIGLQLFQLDELIQLQVKNDGLQNIKIKVVDILGKERISLEQGLVNGDNIIKLPKGELINGAYILTIVVDNYLIKTEKFIVK